MSLFGFPSRDAVYDSLGMLDDKRHTVGFWRKDVGCFGLDVLMADICWLLLSRLHDRLNDK